MSFSANYPTIAPSLLLDFANSNAVDPRVTFTRASTATYFNSIGTLTTAAVNTPRLDYNTTTLAAQGLLIEESRTNSIRNNTMVGAVAGTPGTLPTNWTTFGVGTLTTSVVASGTSNGISYVDVRFSGTSSTTQSGIRFEPANVVAATNGQSWALSLWSSVVGGSTSNIALAQAGCNLYDSGSGFVGGVITININTTSTLSRSTGSGTIAVGTTAFIQPQLYFTCAIGVAIDITLRIGLPQLELGAFATSVIPTTTAAVTRSADVASVNTLSPWYNATEGTLYSESLLTRQSATAGTNVFYIWNTSTSEIKLYYRGAGTTGATVVDATVNQADLTPTGVLTANTVAKLSLAYKANDFASSGNGGTVVTDATGTVPTGMSQVILGGPSGILNGYLRRITYYPIRLSNANLQALTS